MPALLYYQANQLLAEIKDKKLLFPRSEEAGNRLLNVLVENPIVRQGAKEGYIVIGEWEGKPEKEGSKLVWLNIADLGRYLDEADKELLQDFRESFVEVTAPTNDIIGLASREEADYYGLMGRKVYLLVFDDNGRLMKQERGLANDRLLVSEDFNEAACRVLFKQLGIIANPTKIKEGTVYDEKLRVNYAIFKCFQPHIESKDYISFIELKKSIEANSGLFDDESSIVFQEYLKGDAKKVNSVDFKVVHRR
jgi:hypothetical protein